MSLVVTIPNRTVIGDDTGTGIPASGRVLRQPSVERRRGGKCDAHAARTGHAVEPRRRQPAEPRPRPARRRVAGRSRERGGRRGELGGRRRRTPNVRAGVQRDAVRRGPGPGPRSSACRSREEDQHSPRARRPRPRWHLSGGCTDAKRARPGVRREFPPRAPRIRGRPSSASVVCGDGVRTDTRSATRATPTRRTRDATCRTDRTAQRCGDGIVDPGTGEQCEATADAAAFFHVPRVRLFHLVRLHPSCRAWLTARRSTTAVQLAEDPARCSDRPTRRRATSTPGPLKVKRTAPVRRRRSSCPRARVHRRAHLPSAAGSGARLLPHRAGSRRARRSTATAAPTTTSSSPRTATAPAPKVRRR